MNKVRLHCYVLFKQSVSLGLANNKHKNPIYCIAVPENKYLIIESVPWRLFFAALQRIAITWRPKYYKKMRYFITRRNQKEYGPDVK